MVMATFIPPVTPDQGMDVNSEPRFISTAFGDGYKQEIPDGINALQRKMSPRWTNAKYAEANPIIAFLEAKSLTREPFWWTPNGETSPRALKCLKFTYSWKKGRYCDISADFEETGSR